MNQCGDLMEFNETGVVTEKEIGAQTCTVIRENKM